MSGNSPLDQDANHDAGACLTAPGSREPSPDGLGPSGFDPSRWVGDKYSPNLLKWLKREKRMTTCKVYRWEDCSLWIGYSDGEGWFYGAMLMQVLSGRRGGGQIFAHIPRWAARLVEEPGFWAQYDRVGRCAIDPQHVISFIGSETRWQVSGDHRHCLWCNGHDQHLHRWTETVERSRWVVCDSDGSGEAGETGTGSTEGDSAGRQASPDQSGAA